MRKLLLTLVAMLAGGPASAQYRFLMVDGLPINSEAVVLKDAFACDADVLDRLYGYTGYEPNFPKSNSVVGVGFVKRMIEQNRCRILEQSTPVVVTGNQTVKTNPNVVITQVRMASDKKLWWIATDHLARQ